MNRGRLGPNSHQGPRILALCMVGFLVLVLSSTVFSWWALGPLRLDPLLVVVVAAGFRLTLGAGGVVAAILGYFFDVLSGGVLGLGMTTFVFVAVICAGAALKLDIESWPFQMVAVGILSILWQFLMVAGLILAGREHLLPVNLVWVLAAQALLNALAAPVFFFLLDLMVLGINRMWPRGKRP